jgi:hypothetical protein
LAVWGGTGIGDGKLQNTIMTRRKIDNRGTVARSEGYCGTHQPAIGLGSELIDRLFKVCDSRN